MSGPLVVAARINDRENLSSLLQFGRITNQKRRVGMLLELGANVGLEVAAPVPFIIGARLNGREEQFLCPSVGKLKV